MFENKILLKNKDAQPRFLLYHAVYNDLGVKTTLL